MITERIKIPAHASCHDAIEQAARILSQGGLVAFPTETVYGLAANADLPEAIDRLAQLKERPDNKPFSLHIGQKTDLPAYVPYLNLLNRCFINKAWPGPLTIVFELNSQQEQMIAQSLPAHQREALYYNHSIGIRLPENYPARQLLCAVPAPIVASSANLAGAAAATSADDVLHQLEGKIDLVLDAGPTKYAKPSTIVKLHDHGMEILRTGVLDAPMVERMHSATILFVCTGNTCRSAMAEGLCRRIFAEKLGCSVDQLPEKGYKITSAGVMAYKDANASPDAVEVCSRLDVDIRHHKAQPLTVELIHQADFIFPMTRSHLEVVCDLVPAAADRTVLFAGNQDLDDPLGMGIEEYRRCAGLIEQGLRQRFADEIL